MLHLFWLTEEQVQQVKLFCPRSAAVAGLMIVATYLKAQRTASSLKKRATRHG